MASNLRFFITGIGTGVGKTLITATLAHQFRAEGQKVKALKPLVSGMEEFRGNHLNDSDPGQLLQSLGLPVSREAVASISPWQFEAPLSPDMAARKEGGPTPSARELADWCEAQAEGADVCLVEGVGGVCVPINETETVLDWMRLLGWPVILVGGSYLGAISHTLTACAALQQADIPVHGMVVSASDDGVELPETVTTLMAFLELPIVTMDRLVHDGPTQEVMLWEQAPPLVPWVRLPSRKG